MLAVLVSAVADSATVDGGESIGRVLRHVRCNVEVPHVGYKVSRIEALVGAHGDALGARRIAHDHVFRGFALDRARHLSQFRLDDEAVAVLGHDIARIGELCLLTFALLGEFGFRIRGGGVRLVAAPFAVKVALAIAPRRWRYPNRPSPRSSSSMPKLRPACHRPKSARPRAGHAPAFGQEARPETCAPPRPQAAGHGSS